MTHDILGFAGDVALVGILGAVIIALGLCLYRFWSNGD